MSHYKKAHLLKKPSNPNTESLERMKKWPSLARHWAGRKVVIWTGQHKAFWGPGRVGYYDRGGAGVYSFEEAFTITNHCSHDKEIFFDWVHEEELKRDRVKQGFEESFAIAAGFSQWAGGYFFGAETPPQVLNLQARLARLEKGDA